MQSKSELQKEYDGHKAKNLKLDMSRGKPSPEQLDLSDGMFTILTGKDYKSAAGFDCRNYGLLDGLPEAKQLFADILGVTAAQVFVGGNSSLQLMYDVVSLLVSEYEGIGTPKFLCPVPGYDRHFAITEHLGVTMVNVPVTETGVDVARVRELVKDPAVIGMWCVPMYSNPGGITYTDDTVRGLASLKPANRAFRIMWDNAYVVHHISADTAEHSRVLPIIPACEASGNPDLVYEFASTSKMTHPGAGISAIVSSVANLARITKEYSLRTIGFDKLNQLRHVRFFEAEGGIAEHMKKHARVLAPRFALVLQRLEPLREYGCNWHAPQGGYFVSFNGKPNTAKATVQLCKDAGVVLTGAGAAFPYGKDPDDSNIRIAPTYPSLEELAAAMDVFVTAAMLCNG